MVFLSGCINRLQPNNVRLLSHVTSSLSITELIAYSITSIALALYTDWQSDVIEDRLIYTICHLKIYTNIKFLKVSRHWLNSMYISQLISFFKGQITVYLKRIYKYENYCGVDVISGLLIFLLWTPVHIFLIFLQGLPCTIMPYT